MKTAVLETVVAILAAALLVLATFGAAAQSTDAGTAPAAGSTKDEKAKDFAAKHKALQDASKSSASGTGATPPATEAAKFKSSGKDMMNQMQSNQTFKGSKPVDKNAKATAPTKDVKTMTPEERAQRRKEIVQESKP
jgi:hypothetical protein